VAQDPRLRALAGESWDLVQGAVQVRCQHAREAAFVNGLTSKLLAFTLGAVRYRQEEAKETSRRGADYRTDQALQQRPAPPVLERVDEAQDRLALAKGLQEAVDQLGAKHPFVEATPAGRSPEAAAQALLEGTRLLDPAQRRALLGEEPRAILESRDPLVVLARRIDRMVGDAQKTDEAAQAVLSEQGTRIAKARFAVYGRHAYPDATFSLRLSYGAVEPYPANGTLTQPFTTLGGLFDRADAWGPEAQDHAWELPLRWQAARGTLTLSTPFNLITNNDIIGGNSGSPLLDRAGDLVGLIFDGNIESISGRYYFDPRVNRAIAVDGRGILEALDKVYHAQALLKEIRGR
jgi:hypothetical protein